MYALEKRRKILHAHSPHGHWPGVIGLLIQYNPTGFQLTSHECIFNSAFFLIVFYFLMKNYFQQSSLVAFPFRIPLFCTYDEEEEYSNICCFSVGVCSVSNWLKTQDYPYTHLVFACQKHFIFTFQNNTSCNKREHDYTVCTWLVSLGAFPLSTEYCMLVQRMDSWQKMIQESNIQ